MLTKLVDSSSSRSRQGDQANTGDAEEAAARCTEADTPSEGHTEDSPWEAQVDSPPWFEFQNSADWSLQAHSGLGLHTNESDK